MLLQPSTGSAQQAADMSAAAVARLIERAERGVDDPKGWATDILASLQEYGIDRSRQNVCSVIAIVDQESSFVADPPVKGLGRIAHKAITSKLAALPGVGDKVRLYLETHPSPETSYLEMIRTAKTEKDLDLAYRRIVAELSAQWKLAILLNSKYLSGLVEKFNEIDTIGSMQTSVRFAVSVEEKKAQKRLTLDEINVLRDFMYTRKGGLMFGTLLLLGYKAGYDDRVYLFADFNAGRYSSRNAAFQSVVSKLAKRKLALDGDLLIYKDGSPSNSLGQTESTIRLLAREFSLGVTEAQIRSDLLKEKSNEFAATATFAAVTDLYRRELKADPPFAVIPNIALDSVKLSHKMTTRKFAQTVKGRYNSCMKS